MNPANAFLREIPWLRRFARALCGSQMVADRQIEAVLVRARTEPDLMEGNGSPRVILFRAFCRVWRSMNGDDHLLQMLLPGDCRGPERILAAITPNARQAFLLSSLEGFSPPEVADILECSQIDVADLLRDARMQIAQQAATGVLIIEDKVAIAEHLKTAVEEMGHWVQGVTGTLSETRSVISELERFHLRPGIVLADVFLADGASGIDVVNDIMAHGDVPVILIGGLPHNAVAASLPKPMYMLRDPFSRESLGAAISQALFFQGSGTTIEF
ncbi:MAG: response regulator [Pseudomonadota bacterium]